MRITINKDLEEDYKDQLFAGYSFKEMFWICIAGGMVIGAAYLFHIYLKLPLETSIYVGVPFGIPAVFLGFKKFQGLTVWEYLKELDYEKKTRLLLYDADEITDKKFIFKIKKRRNRRNDRSFKNHR